jgi:hypothetical protein
MMGRSLVLLLAASLATTASGLPESAVVLQGRSSIERSHESMRTAALASSRLSVPRHAPKAERVAIAADPAALVRPASAVTSLYVAPRLAPPSRIATSSSQRDPPAPPHL